MKENNISFIYIFLYIILFIFILIIFQRIFKTTKSSESFVDFSDFNIFKKEYKIAKAKTCKQKCQDDSGLEVDAIDLDKNGDANFNSSNSKFVNKKLRNFKYNNVNYEGISNTNCYNMNDDFDNWCRFNYTPSETYPLPDGYTLNNIGAQIILNGKDGDCPNENLSRAICDFNSIHEIPKLDHAIKEDVGDYSDNSAEIDKYPLDVDYDVFTDCLPLGENEDSSINNFKKNCAQLLKKRESDVVPVEIMGYDCTPGYYRSKCKKIVNFR